MKNSAQYALKVKKLLSGLKRPAIPLAADSLGLLVQSVLAEDATPEELASAVAAVQEEFVDHNELRVSLPRDVCDILGRDFPGARVKAEAIARALNAVFDRANALCLDFLAKKPKREIRKLLREELGLSPFAESVLTLYYFQGHAIPVDQLLLEALKLEQVIDPGSDIDDCQGFLERIVPAKDAVAVHEQLRCFAAQQAPKVRQVLARRHAELEAKLRAKAEAEARAKAEAEAKAAAAAEAAAAKVAAKKAAAKRAAAKLKAKVGAARAAARKKK